MKITMDGKYQTRDGKPVRILAVDAIGHLPVIALISRGGPEELILRLTSEGNVWPPPEDHPYDLVVAPREITGWMNVYKGQPDQGSIYTLLPSKEQADIESGPHRIACIQVTFKEGDGL